MLLQANGRCEPAGANNNAEDSSVPQTILDGVSLTGRLTPAVHQ
ncbi:unnamed protein product [Gemmata massiliana]|uniref:Uncharacterized protein n=1 Tax=Gemmata massiliana TaxID=1210884 RepID=A0A6P2D787_9BACT|nr:unnamed protein product [Gemmata massiliana]